MSSRNDMNNEESAVGDFETFIESIGQEGEVVNDDVLADAFTLLDACDNTRAINIEEVHQLADEILCAVLQKLGYTKAVEAYNKITKYYA